jgi:hypothetical protein
MISMKDRPEGSRGRDMLVIVGTLELAEMRHFGLPRGRSGFIKGERSWVSAKPVHLEKGASSTCGIHSHVKRSTSN